MNVKRLWDLWSERQWNWKNYPNFAYLIPQFISNNLSVRILNEHLQNSLDIERKLLKSLNYSELTPYKRMRLKHVSHLSSSITSTVCMDLIMRQNRLKEYSSSIQQQQLE